MKLSHWMICRNGFHRTFELCAGGVLDILMPQSMPIVKLKLMFEFKFSSDCQDLITADSSTLPMFQRPAPKPVFGS